MWERVRGGERVMLEVVCGDVQRMVVGGVIVINGEMAWG